MKWKIAAASVLTAAIVSAPVAGAAPANGNGNTGGTRPSIGQTISQIAKSGGGALGVLTQLSQLKPNNKGLAKALQNLLNRKPPTGGGTGDNVTPPA